MWSPLVDLAMTPQEQEDCGMVMGAADTAPRYPWGMKLRFTKAEIEKLKLSDNVNVGDLFDARIFGTVTSVSKCQRSDGTDDYSIEIQCEKMSVEDEMTEDTDD